MQNIITKIDKSSFAVLPDGFEDRFNITDDESIEVYKAYQLNMIKMNPLD